MKREVKILGLSYSQTQVGSYVVVLSERNGHRKLPIIIKSQDAQVIALKVEDMKSPRPLTHDLFQTVCDGFNLECREVVIYQVAEGIFYARLILTNGIDDINVEATAGDAIALSLVLNSPLYVVEEVLESCGIITDDSGSIAPETKTKKPKKSKKNSGIVSVNDLEKMMQDALSKEDYEIAAELRDKIAMIKSNEGTQEKND